MFFFKMLFRKISAKKRAIPDFIIIGAQKAGTSSLYNYICHHPKVLNAYRKEVHFFDFNYGRGLNWYRSFFPKKKLLDTKNCITGEASPYYIFDKNVPVRIKKLNKKIKFIVLLRNPVDRAFSHYNHNLKKGHETRDAEDAIVPLKSEHIELKDYEKDYIRNYSYLERGIYSDQIKYWLSYFPKKDFLFIKSEDLYQDKQGKLNEVFNFLGLPDFVVNDEKVYLKNSYKRMNNELEERLNKFYKSELQEIRELLGENFQWEMN